MTCAIDLTKVDEYPEGRIPDADVETCLKVLRTIRNQFLGLHFFDADGVVILSHAHKKIFELVQRAQQEDPAAEANGP